MVIPGTRLHNDLLRGEKGKFDAGSIEMERA